MKKLLIAYDGSSAAESAISDLSNAALPANLDVVVMSVADVYLPPASRLPEAAVPEFPPSLIQKAHDKAMHEVEVHRELAHRACGRVKSMFPKWNCTPVAVGDSPGWAIVRKATEWNADLVVVGAQSHSALERLFLGSVSHKVVAESPCSVRVGRHHRATDELRIMVAVDGSIDSKAALDGIAARTWSPGTKFRIIVVADQYVETAMSWPGFFPANFVQANDENGREWINRMAAAASKILFDAGLDVLNDIYDGHPKEVLLRVSEEWQADAIFLGARGLNHGKRYSLGTVASAVASRALCSVELVRAKE
jgi:nucleotide-binding universal stress UspA family protein